MKFIIYESETVITHYNEPDITKLRKNNDGEWELRLECNGSVQVILFKTIQWIDTLYEVSEQRFARKITKSFYEMHPELRDKILDKEIEKLAREKKNRQILYEHEENKEFYGLKPQERIELINNKIQKLIKERAFWTKDEKTEDKKDGK